MSTITSASTKATFQSGEETVTVEIHGITKVTGLAGSVAFTAYVSYEGHGAQEGQHWSEDAKPETFVGSAYGGPGPVISLDHKGMQSFVIDPERFGDELSDLWVRRYFLDR